MTSFLVTLFVFMLVIVMMSVGYIFKGKKIQGSCGGLNAAITNASGEKVCGFCGITYEQAKKEGCQENA